MNGFWSKKFGFHKSVVTLVVCKDKLLSYYVLFAGFRVFFFVPLAGKCFIIAASNSTLVLYSTFRLLQWKLTQIIDFNYFVLWVWFLCFNSGLFITETIFLGEQ